MAYEILNYAQVDPRRLRALLRLVARQPQATKQELYDLLQPQALQTDSAKSSQDAAQVVLRAAVNCKLLSEQEGDHVALAVPAQRIESTVAFRLCIQEKLLGVVDDAEPNHLLNLYAAWYAVQDEQVLQLTPDNLARRFNDDLFPDASGDERAFNTTKLRGWEQWAAFVGWGWLLAIGRTRAALVPDANDRLATVLPAILSAAGVDAAGIRPVPFAAFAQTLGRLCPELDGGELFERCWQASRGALRRGNRLSLMLSAALRGLHDAGRIELIREADATETWQLYHATGHPLQEVTHVARGRARRS